MKNLLLVAAIPLIILVTLIVSADVGYNNPNLPGIEKTGTAACSCSVNYSTVNVNNSLYWQGHTGTDGSWLTGVFHLNKDNWNLGSDWLTYSEPTLDFNESKLSTIYYNATQSTAVAGTINGGTLGDTQHPNGLYDEKSFNFSEVSGTPGLDIRFNFTGVVSINQLVIRYKTSSLSGSAPNIELWDYVDSAWETYPLLAQSTSFVIITQPVFDGSRHVSGNLVQMRLYKSSNGNTNNHYYIDWLAMSKGFGTPSGVEVDPIWNSEKSGYYNSTQIDERQFINGSNVAYQNRSNNFTGNQYFGSASGNFTVNNSGAISFGGGAFKMYYYPYNATVKVLRIGVS